MEHQCLQIAIVTPNVLMNLGLRSIIERIVPIAEVCTFTSAEEMLASGEKFIHSFVSAHIFIKNTTYFLERGIRPIILTDSTAPIANLAGIPHLNINQDESSLVRDILRLHQGAHHSSRDSHHAHCRQNEELRCNPHHHSPQMCNKEVLSPREIEVLSLIVKGLLNKEIADRLNIGLTTVISHRRNIVEKLGVCSVSALTIYAVMRGYVNINEI